MVDWSVRMATTHQQSQAPSSVIARLYTRARNKTRWALWNNFRTTYGMDALLCGGLINEEGDEFI